MVIGLIGFALSSEKGLDFIVSLAFVLIFFLFIWYASKISYKSKEDRKKHNKLAFMLLSLIILISILEIIGMTLFFPSMNVSLKPDKITGVPIFIIILLIGCLILDNIRKKKFG